jgi:arabinogalactan oligomer/maltooligosaccharide transport system substrate-binding protein
MEWAHTFIDFLASEEGAGIMYQQKGTMTARANVSNVPGLRDDPWLLGIAQQSPFSTPMPSIPEVEHMWGPLDSLFIFTWNGDLSIAGAMDKAMETYDMELQMAGKSR